MSAKLLVLIAVLVGFSVQTAHALVTLGYVGFFEQLLGTLAGRQATVDIVIACSLVLFWLVDDARARGRAWLPYAALTLVLGSIGPLAYLIHRELAPGRTPAAARA
jgi:hypothetical protein